MLLSTILYETCSELALDHYLVNVVFEIISIAFQSNDVLSILGHLLGRKWKEK